MWIFDWVFGSGRSQNMVTRSDAEKIGRSYGDGYRTENTKLKLLNKDLNEAFSKDANIVRTLEGCIVRNERDKRWEIHDTHLASVDKCSKTTKWLKRVTDDIVDQSA